MMERVLEAERPDLVVFTGDNVNGMTSNDAYSVSRGLYVRYCMKTSFC